MQIRFWGVRGSIPTPGPDTVKYGGNTSCIDVLTADRQSIIIDAGSGIRQLGKVLKREYPKRVVGNILISHTHWDHIQGFPFFEPVFDRQNRFVLVGQKRVDRRLEEILAGQIVEPYMPFSYGTIPADLIVKEVEDGETIILGENTIVTVASMKHPGGCLGYRIESEDAVFAYCCDTGHDPGHLTPGVLALAQDADLLVHDTHFLSLEQSKQYSSWGHSSWQEATQVALEAQVKNLALFHYAPESDDSLVEEMGIRAREVFPRTILAREGMILKLPLVGDLSEHH